MQPNLVARYAKKTKDAITNGTVGLEVIGTRNPTGGVDKSLELKAGKLGKIDVPYGKTARYARELGKATVNVGKTAAALAAEKVTGKDLERDIKTPVTRRRTDTAGNYTYD